MSNDTKQAEAKRRLNITLSSFTMFAVPRTRKDKKQLRLTFGCSNGYPNVNVETDEEGEATLENGFLRLSSRLNGVNFFAFLNLIEKALTEGPGWTQGIECFHTYKDGQVFEEAQKINDLKVGVDNQGLVYITILQAGRTSAKYVFGPTEWHNYRDQNGDSLTQKDQNHICAKATIDGLRIAMGSAIALDCMDLQVSNAGLPSPSKKPEGGNFSSGNSNQNSGYQNNGGYQKKPWQGNNNQNGGYQKKPWQGNNNGGNNNGGQNNYNRSNYQNNNNNGGYQKKPWQGNNNQNGGYQKKPWQGNNNNGGNNQNNQQQNQKSDSFADDEIEF